MSLEVRRAVLHSPHLVAAKEEGQGGVGPVDLALRFVPDFGKAEVGPRLQQETFLGAPGAAREASEDFFVPAQIHLFDEPAQPGRKVDLDVHSLKGGERDGEDHVVGVDHQVGREGQPKFGALGLNPPQHPVELDLSPQRLAESLDDLAAATLQDEFLVART